MRIPRSILCVGVLTAATALSACSGYLAGQLVDARHAPIVEVPRNADGMTPMDLLTAHEFDAPTDDGASLRVSVVDPADRSFSCRWLPAGTATTDAAEREKGTVRMDLIVSDDGRPVGTARTEFQALPADPDPSPRGTIVLLHGLNMDRWQMMTWAVELAGHGWRTVLVDLRGHGESGGRYRTWGMQDGKDLAGVADELARRGLLVEPLAVIGNSYGGAAAIHWAAADHRVAALVTVAAFANPGQAILEAAGSARLFGVLPIPAGASARSVERAGAMIGNDLVDGDSPVTVAPAVRAPWLIVHGREDRMVAPSHAQRLHDAAPHSTLRWFDGLGHLDIMIRQDSVSPQVRRWLDAATRPD